jgi:putative phosphoribosyl transferase
VAAHAGPDAFDEVRDREVAELRRRERTYRAGRPPEPLTGRAVVLVDDGLATGATMRAAVAAVRRQAPASLTVAVPVGSSRACGELAPDVDRVVCLESPASFRAVGQAYRDFSETPDDEVVAALAGSP